MSVRVSQYGKQMEKTPAGKSAMAQHKRAVHMSSTTTKEDKYDKPSLVDRVMLGMMKLGKGKGTKTQRTKTVESGLKQAGLTNKEMARFQRSKKGK